MAPQKINNKGFFALFGILGAGMVVASIWFFFWAKNGGFIWRATDWDDYKSTVLRRKDENGNTLSNATPRTKLGQQSVAGTFDVERNASISEKNYGRERNGKAPVVGMDDDVRAYRHERPARVGGMNRRHDGSHFDYSVTDESDIVSNSSRVHLTPKKPIASPVAPPKKKGFMERKRESKLMKRREKEAKAKVSKPSMTQTRATAARATPIERRASPERRAAPVVMEMSSVPETRNPYGYQPTHESYFSQYRPQQSAQQAAPQIPRHSSPRRSYANSPSHSRQPSPVKSTRLPMPPGSYDAYSDAGASERGSVYNTQHIPQFSRGTGGFRRDGGYGRRDSLSDSDGDLGSMR